MVIYTQDGIVIFTQITYNVRCVQLHWKAQSGLVCSARPLTTNIRKRKL